MEIANEKNGEGEFREGEGRVVDKPKEGVEDISQDVTQDLSVDDVKNAQ